LNILASKTCMGINSNSMEEFQNRIIIQYLRIIDSSLPMLQTIDFIWCPVIDDPLCSTYDYHLNIVSMVVNILTICIITFLEYRIS